MDTYETKKLRDEMIARLKKISANEAIDPGVRVKACTALLNVCDDVLYNEQERERHKGRPTAAYDRG